MPHNDRHDEACFGGLGGAIKALQAESAGAGSGQRANAGLAVYRNNVRAAYLRALADTFPVVHRLVGEDFFRYLAHEYFHAHPPRSPLAGRYGDALPEFLKTFEPVKNLLYLPDIARLECAWLIAYHAREARSLDPQAIIEATGGEPEGFCFNLHPSMQLISSDFPIHTIWAHNQNDNAGPLKAGAGAEHILIARPDEAVFIRTISKAAFVAIGALQKGEPLSAALEAAASAEAQAGLSEILGEILSAEIITSVEQSA